MLSALLASLWDQADGNGLPTRELLICRCKDQQIHRTSLLGMVWTCLDLRSSLFATEAQAPPTSTRD